MSIASEMFFLPTVFKNHTFFKAMDYFKILFFFLVGNGLSAADADFLPPSVLKLYLPVYGDRETWRSQKFDKTINNR